MATGRAGSDAQRRLGRAGPSPSEMELLRAATLCGDAASAAFRRWIAVQSIDDAPPREVALLPAVSAHLSADDLGAEADRLRGLRRRVWVETELHLALLGSAVEVLATHDNHPLLTRDAARSITLYPEAGTRQIGALDLCIGPEQFDDAARTLVAAGWRRDPVPDKPFDRSIRLRDPNDRLLGLHQFVLFPRFVATPERAWIERATTGEVATTTIRRFRCADEMVLAILEGLFSRGTHAARWPLDVAAAAQRGPLGDGVTPEEFWDEVVESTISIGAGPIVASALGLCCEELEVPVPVEAVRTMAGADLDRHLAQHWALCRRGILPEWRLRRYRRLRRAEGRPANLTGYIMPRAAELRSRGLRRSFITRVRRVKPILQPEQRRSPPVNEPKATTDDRSSRRQTGRQMPDDPRAEP